MKMKHALEIASQIVNGDAYVLAHYGNNRHTDRAVRLFGCDINEATELASQIATKINGTVREAAGFVAVWF